MPILAVPYLLPFAEAAGIVIAGLGLMEISKQVQKFMDINPEETFQILRMIMPQEGIAAMFEQLFNERGDDDELDEKEAVKEREEEVDFEEEDLTKLSGKEKGKRMKEEALKKKGSYQSPEATGSYASKRGRMIGMAEKLGLAEKGLKDKPYKKSSYDWKKWTRKADGGIMDVL